MNKKLYFLFFNFFYFINQNKAANNIINQNADDDVEYMVSKKESARKKRKREKEQLQAALEAKQEFEDAEKLSFDGDTIPVMTIKHSSAAQNEKKVSFFCYPLVFTDEGISSFFNHSFNREEYGKEFLPHNLGHLGQIIRHGQSHGLSKEFTEGAFRLFHQKLKSCPYVSAPAIELFLNENTPYLELQLAKQEFGLWKEIKDLLIERFKSQFSFLQDNPLGFFDYVAKELDEKINTNVISPERARATLVRFLNSALDKIIWSPDDQEKTWESFKKIGNSLHYLHTAQVIPDHLDINDLYWSLIERYCYFLELVGTKLNLETCQLMKHDLAEKKIDWLLISEQEKGITTKLEKIAHAILETETRIIAKNNGIFTEKYLLNSQQP